MRGNGWPGGATRWQPAALLAAGILCTGCPTVVSTATVRPETADKWYRRAQVELQSADVEEARDSVGKALTIAPQDADIRILAARIALARLDYDETLRLLKGMRSSEASGLRGRARWYKGELDSAADELEAMLDDPGVKDDWAKSITKLARQGAGRSPFMLSGAMLAAVDMQHVSPTDALFVVPLEIDGAAGLAVVSTGVTEVLLDSATRNEPSWVSIRFKKLDPAGNLPTHFEIHDVPALPKDLADVARELGAPIKAVIGVNLLRHMNVTIDYYGHQFVVRNFSPPPPPDATRIPVHYMRGGGMVLQAAFGGEGSARASMLVDTSRTFDIVLDNAGWKKAGIDAASLKLLPQDPQQKLREGLIPALRLGAFNIPKVPGIYGFPITDLEKNLTLDIDGIVGAGLLSEFRITFGDGGRLMWIEDSGSLLRLLQRGRPGSLSLPEDAPLPPELPGIGPELPLLGPPPAPPGANPATPSDTPSTLKEKKKDTPPPKDKKTDGGSKPRKAPPGP